MELPLNPDVYPKDCRLVKGYLEKLTIKFLKSVQPFFFEKLTTGQNLVDLDFLNAPKIC